MLACQRCKQTIPNLVWAGSIVTRARKENRIANDYMMLALIEQIDKFRGLAVSIQGVKSLWGDGVVFPDWAPGTLTGGV